MRFPIKSYMNTANFIGISNSNSYVVKFYVHISIIFLGSLMTGESKGCIPLATTNPPLMCVNMKY